MVINPFATEEYVFGHKIHIYRLVGLDLGVSIDTNLIKIGGEND